MRNPAATLPQQSHPAFAQLKAFLQSVFRFLDEVHRTMEEGNALLSQARKRYPHLLDF